LGSATVKGGHGATLKAVSDSKGEGETDKQKKREGLPHFESRKRGGAFPAKKRGKEEPI